MSEYSKLAEEMWTVTSELRAELQQTKAELQRAQKEQERVHLYLDDANAEIARLREQVTALCASRDKALLDRDQFLQQATTQGFELDRMRKALEDAPHDAYCKIVIWLVMVKPSIGKINGMGYTVEPPVCTCWKSRAMNPQPSYKSPETPWKPVADLLEYEQRINENGHLETRPKPENPNV